AWCGAGTTAPPQPGWARGIEAEIPHLPVAACAGQPGRNWSGEPDPARLRGRRYRTVVRRRDRGAAGGGVPCLRGK
ncbi:MAG: hypothetical protein ACLFS5_13255, partial [Spirochaetaceae bacterium]